MTSTNNEKLSDTPLKPEISTPCTFTGYAESKKYFFGARGKALVRQISFAGGLGFFLFGYDQGVLGVSQP